MLNWKNPDYAEIWESRKTRLKVIREKPETHKALCAFYSENPVEFITDWGTTFDPRKEDPLIPFILFPKQIEYINWIRKRIKTKSDGLVEKSRDMGATWLNMAFAIWLWLFNPGRKIGFGSRKEILVDRLGDMDSIFEKGRMFLKYLPNEFKPKGFSVELHCQHLKILNPENGSMITGEAGDQIGRGGRSSIYFKDESAFYERAERIEAALSMNSDVKIDVSTPNGSGNPFYNKRVGGQVPVFTLHWRDYPGKDENWYIKKKKEIDNPVIVAQELDINYNASVENICIPSEWVQAAVDYKIQETGVKIAGLDVADEGADENCLVIRHGVKVKTIESWKEGNTTQTTRKAYGICKDKGVKILQYDSIGVGAGVKGEIWSINQVEKKTIINPKGVNTGGAPLDGKFAPGKPNKEMFKNLRANLWWNMRTKFQKVFNMKYNGMSYPIDELISIPNDPGLILEISQPKYFYTDTGKIQIESKKNMKKRLIKSPNKADALILCFAKIQTIDYNLFTQ